ncbi:MAG: hypothetical protein IPM38_05680 [Ignavibacteria bacterium]|nr:hypothetical protein [Ignavibacteria bacterium]
MKIESKKYIPKILIDSKEEFPLLEKFSNEGKVEIDKKTILGEGHEQFASPLSEYEVLILDFNGRVSTVPVNRQNQIMNYLLKGKTIIYFLRKHFSKSPKIDNYKLARSILTLNNFNSSDFGNKFELTLKGKSSLFKNYLECNSKNYKVSIENNEQIISLANNTEGNSVAFISHEYSCFHFLPFFNESKEEFEKIILNLAIESLNSGEEVDEWVKCYSFEKLLNIDLDVKKIEDQIDKLELLKEDKIHERENYERIRDTLLFRDGKILEEVTKEVLLKLGIKAEDGTVGKEDLKFIYDKNHLFVKLKVRSDLVKKSMLVN